MSDDIPRDAWRPTLKGGMSASPRDGPMEAFRIALLQRADQVIE